LGIGPGGTIIRKSFFDKIGGYPVIYGVPGDMYFNLKAVCFSPVVMLPFDIVYYRRHEGQEINNAYSYLVHNYTYLRDALNLLPLPIEDRKVEWLKKKNKRRFVVNVFRYFKKTKSLAKASAAMKEAEFGIKEAIIGLFH
jgi:hypothetical protein